MVSCQTPAESGIFWGVASLSHKSVTRDWEPNSDSDLPGGGGWPEVQLTPAWRTGFIGAG